MIFLNSCSQNNCALGIRTTVALFKNIIITKYNRTFLGVLWSFLNPLLSLAVLGIVFSRVFRFAVDDYILYLLSGIVPWNMVAQMVTGSTSVFLANSGLMKKIALPKYTYLLAFCCVAFFEALLSLVAMIVIVVLLGYAVSFHVFLAIPAFLLLFIFCYGLCLALSTLTCYFIDLTNITNVIMQIAFFLVPVIYPMSMIEGGRLEYILKVNPFYWYIDLFRSSIYHHSMYNIEALLITLLCSALSLLIGLKIYYKLEKQLIYKL